MKKSFWIIALIIVLMLSFTACEASEVISREPIEVKYIEEHNQTILQYRGKFLMPTIIHHDESWNVLYKETLDNGKVRDRWREVSEEEYLQAKAVLIGGETNE